jgi:hypothetical protein
VTFSQVLLALLCGLVANELCDASPWLARRALRRAIQLRYPDNSVRASIRREELEAVCANAPGKLIMLLVALSFLSAAIVSRAIRAAGIRRRVSATLSVALSLRLLLVQVLIGATIAGLLVDLGMRIDFELVGASVPSYDVIPYHVANAAQLAMLVIVVTRVRWRLGPLSLVAVLAGGTIGQALSFSFPMDTYFDYDGVASVVVMWLGVFTVLTIRGRGVALKVALAGVAGLAIESGVLMRAYFALSEGHRGYVYLPHYLPFGSLDQLVVNVDWDFATGMIVGCAAFLAKAALARSLPDAQGSRTGC